MRENYITCREAAEVLGVTVETVWRWVRDRKIPAYRIGRIYRLKLSEIVGENESEANPS